MTTATKTIAIAGASGLVGSALAPALTAAGHRVLRLVRRDARDGSEIAWDPALGELDPARLDGVDTVINLAGENIAAGRWTPRRREAIFQSRVDATRTLVAAMKRMARKPETFLSASAVGFYGDRGDDEVDETDGIGAGFLPEVCLAWETHAEGAMTVGIRTVLLRFGVVLAADGGALAKMLPIFRAGLGGRLGAGGQWMSWVSREDVCGAILHLLAHRDVWGPVNMVAPQAVTNREFTTVLGEAVKRPAFVPVPAFALRAVVGRAMADEALLASTRAVPAKLVASGYVFHHPELRAALQAIL